MGTTTSRVKLYKPTEVGELLDIAKLNENFDKLDLVSGARQCTSTTRPSLSEVYGGMVIQETDTHRVYVWDTGYARWIYLGGGHGDPAPTTGANNTNGIDFSVTGPTSGGSYQDGIEPYVGTDRWGPELIRDSNGDAAIQGTLVNAGAFTGWSVNIQYVFAKLHLDAIAAGFSIPARDVVAPGAMSISGVTSYDPCTFIVRGSGAGSGYIGAPGDIILQPSVTRAGPHGAGSTKFTIPNGILSWRL